MTQQKNSRKGSAVWPMVLSWLSSLILALLAVFVMLFTTFGNVGYMQSCVKSSGYAQSAYDDMVQDFISYGAATGFDADVMTGFMSVDQVESDMQDAVAGLYAKTLTYYTRDNIAGSCLQRHGTGYGRPWHYAGRRNQDGRGNRG